MTGQVYWPRDLWYNRVSSNGCVHDSNHFTVYCQLYTKERYMIYIHTGVYLRYRMHLVLYRACSKQTLFHTDHVTHRPETVREFQTNNNIDLVPHRPVPHLVPETHRVKSIAPSCVALLDDNRLKDIATATERTLSHDSCEYTTQI